MDDSLGWVRFSSLTCLHVVSSRQLLPIADQIDRIPEWIIGVFSHWYPLHPRRGMRAEDASQQQPPSAEVKGTNTDRLEVLYSRPLSYLYGSRTASTSPVLDVDDELHTCPLIVT